MTRTELEAQLPELRKRLLVRARAKLRGEGAMPGMTPGVPAWRLGAAAGGGPNDAPVQDQEADERGNHQAVL